MGNNCENDLLPVSHSLNANVSHLPIRERAFSDGVDSNAQPVHSDTLQGSLTHSHKRTLRISLLVTLVLVLGVCGLQWFINRQLLPPADILASAIVFGLTAFIASFRFNDFETSKEEGLWYFDNVRSLGLALFALASISFFPIFDAVFQFHWSINLISIIGAVIISTFAALKSDQSLTRTADKVHFLFQARVAYFVTAFFFACYAAISFGEFKLGADTPVPILNPWKLGQISVLALAAMFFIRSRLPAKNSLFGTKNRQTTTEIIGNFSVARRHKKLLMKRNAPLLPVGIELRGEVARFSQKAPAKESIEDTEYANELSIGKSIRFENLTVPGVGSKPSLILLQGGRPLAETNRQIVKLNAIVGSPARRLSIELGLSNTRDRTKTINLEVTIHWEDGSTWEAKIPVAATTTSSFGGAIKIFIMEWLLKPGRKILEREHVLALRRREAARSDD